MTNLSNPILPVRQLINSVRQLVREGTSIQTWLSAPGPKLLIRICGFSGSWQILIISPEFLAFSGNLGNGLDLSQLLQIHFTLLYASTGSPALLLQPRFTTERHQQATQEQGETQGRTCPISILIARALLIGCVFLCVFISSMVMPCVVISPPRQRSTFCSSLLCCPHFVKSPFITPFSSVSCRNLDRYGCFSMDRVPAASFPVYHLWGSMWRVWHRRFKLLFIKGLFDRQDHLGHPRLKALLWIRCFYLLTYFFIQKYLPRIYYELDMVPGTGDAAVNRLD